MERPAADAKTLLCLAALCLPNSRGSAEFLRALGYALGLPARGVLGSLPLLYDAELNPDQPMLARAEVMAAVFRGHLTREAAAAGLVTVLL
mmetsp:Transcript_28733/g.91991  ORF Transcript_28733/g.91991 Transcript_28733/m.91991 type:complete len:91 (+) Transcript_28733:118-390(+)|eukprot:CAMPEP_0118852512 /NCGR_PEP_ID=MMETSP1163-20130328/1486_1 /TAXON_ID=124430 /ORGANISM="Phaeomonas parva, Strain CCMP2877" /LENGTH=90 /DNA_ID=CAMNT_0006784947 /DNA_START=150 /DNA_END=422 /DNA_ORIENTATION=+